MQNQNMNIAVIDPQKTHALGPDGTYGDLSRKSFHGNSPQIDICIMSRVVCVLISV